MILTNDISMDMMYTYHISNDISIMWVFFDQISDPELLVLEVIC